MKFLDHLNLVTEAIEYIEANLTNAISVECVCDRAQISCWEFQRVFRAVIGDSIGNYIRSRRLTVAAKEIRINPKTRLSDVALKFQFGSHEAFTRAFKAHFAMTPAEFRMSNRTLNTRLKPKLTSEKLRRISLGISKTPTIQKVPSKRFIGLAKQINSPLGNDSDAGNVLPAHWIYFNKRRAEIQGRVRGFGYGIAISHLGRMEEDVLLYLAAAEVEGASPVPKGMMAFEFTEQTYAVFETQGSPETCNAITDYIYGIWLPQSGYIRSEGFDFEIYDNRYRLGQESSISRYFLPIQVNKTC
jgi:AraC family transcriptional regulator